jgi:integration host factor subunit alpha
MTKKDIQNFIAIRANISRKNSLKFIDSFFYEIKKNSLKSQQKISNFGTFKRHITPNRTGRNPKTKEEFPIKSLTKITFSSSNVVKNILN